MAQMSAHNELSLEPTSGQAWRASRLAGELVRLPSGHVARLRRPDLLDMVMSGQVPDSLTPIVEKAFFGTHDDQDPEEVGRSFVEQAGLKGFNTLMEALCRAAFVEPRIVDEPSSDDEISFGDLEFSDKVFVLQWATEEVTQLEKFPAEQGDDVEPSLAGEDLRPAAE